MLTIKDLSIEFHDHSAPETVVHKLNLNMAEGEILGIVGESGSGKTMTALAVAGLLSRHDMKKTGAILFCGEDLLTLSRERLRKLQGKDITMIFQEPMTSLNPVKRIGWQVEESLRLHTKLPKEERQRRVLAALHEVGLNEAEQICRQYPHELSGGMRQRVMIASALICDPKLMIADEPTTALDVTVQAQILELLKRINQQKKTAILFISHDLKLVRKICSRVLVMNQGNVVEQGNVEEIFNHPAKEYTKKLIASIPEIRPGMKSAADRGREAGGL